MKINIAYILMVISMWIFLSLAGSIDARDEGQLDVALTSENRWKELVKKYPIISGWKLSQRGYTTKEGADGLRRELVLTIVSYVSSDNVIVLALTLSEHQEAKVDEAVRLKYFLLGKPCLIEEFEEGQIAVGRTADIIAALRIENIMGLFQTNDKNACELSEALSTPSEGEGRGGGQEKKIDK